MATHTRTFGREEGEEPGTELIERSARAESGLFPDLDHFFRWFAEQRRRATMTVRPIALESLDGWRADPRTGNLHHTSGRFFGVEGLDVRVPEGPVEHWRQPIINQPEVGILGVLMKEFSGVPHLLVQAKGEPGNHNGLQLSPTVQATRSNYTRVHRGARVPYLDHFRDKSRHRVLADILQSEQGSWFFRKQNRNMVVQTDENIEPLDGFCWLTLGQLHSLLAQDDLVNMDLRTVLSCLPFDWAGAAGSSGSGTVSTRSQEPDSHTMSTLNSWFTDARTRRGGKVHRVPLRETWGWRYRNGRISHESEAFFEVVGIGVTATGREVRGWSQPMIRPCDTGVIAFLTKVIEGIPHVLVQAKAEPGYQHAVEIAPTVQCTPSNHESLPGRPRPRYLDEVLHASAEHVHFDAIHSEEGGRFLHARNRYLIVDAPPDLGTVPPDFHWMTPAQLSALLRHSHHVNIEARSLISCLQSLSVRL